jgi:Na+/H+ antiporter NhaD/arsenite permease-like protein
METIEYFSDFLRKMGVPNFLVIGIVIILIWLLISGFRKGLKRGGDKEPQEDEENKNEGPSE